MAMDAAGNPVKPLEQSQKGKEQSVKFCTSTQVPPHIYESYSDKRRYSGVEIMKNQQGLIGGFVIKPAIMDSPIFYLDCNGKYLTMFHIFGADKEKEDATMIIDQLSKTFTVREMLVFKE